MSYSRAAHNPGLFTRVASAARYVFASQTTRERQINGPVELERAIRESNRAAGSIVTPDSAMSIAAFYAGVGLLSESIGQLPMRLYEDKGESDELATTHPLFDLLAYEPNRLQSPFEFQRLIMDHLLKRGNFYALKGGTTRLSELIPLPPDQMEPELDDRLLISYVRSMPDGRKKRYSASEILHIRALNSDGLKGLSVIQAAAKALGLALSGETHGAKQLENGVRADIALKHPKTLSDAAARRLRDSVAEQYTGAENWFKPLLLEDGLDVANLSMSNQDAQFIESRKFQRSEIAMFLRVPPHMIGDIERGTSWGSGLEQQNIGFLTYTLMPYLTNIAQAITRDCLKPEERRKFKVKFDTSMFTRADFGARQAGLQTQLANGVINANEWRRIEGMNPRKGGDAYAGRATNGGGNGA